MGVQIETLGFKGAAEEGSFAVTATLSAPVEILPSLLAGDFPALEDIIVSVQRDQVALNGSICPGGGGYTDPVHGRLPCMHDR